MRILRSAVLSLLLVFVSLGVIALTPGRSEAQYYASYGYGPYSYPYYWSGQYRYRYNPYGSYRNYYYSRYPYYSSTYTYPWRWYY